ncbi:coiled-coil domain-containing protein 160 homolog isoform X2 [Megalobrama amblycephala]|uniref:coiled-coil domain-containing protein 160 homolog isoform X2 n=1 Tax=Megalobrama amblycephala TaxID=75352 RepID=UPI002013CD32|nr:coiled-coil domain-containing protein 160 homolog isoform X2 [Megalobrama amblycephala]
MFFRTMEITGQNPEHEYSSRDDHHWVEKLFPPRFTLQNLLENQTNTNEQCNSSTKSPSSTHSTDMDEPKRSQRRQIYLTALKEVQHTERLRKKEALAKRIIRHEQPIDVRANSENPTDQGEMCIWNERDICKLRTGFAEVERDRWRIKQQLSCTEEQLKAEHEQRLKLQGLVEKLEEQLSLSKKMTTRQDLVINDMKSQSQKMNAQLHKLTIQVREKEEEADRWRTTLSRAKEDMQQVVQERSNLMWELERAQAQWKSERDRLEKAARIENEAVLLRLQREVEQTRADLHAERESHARSRTALELLRRHFSSQ